MPPYMPTIIGQNNSNFVKGSVSGGLRFAASPAASAPLHRQSRHTRQLIGPAAGFTDHDMWRILVIIGLAAIAPPSAVEAQTPQARPSDINECLRGAPRLAVRGCSVLIQAYKGSRDK